ncbi:MAG: hypothetical protein IJT06_01210, partial [Selenomonadaceae bacterium]|nr:hypothetical protein [Selenomonadaceae bacterium]
MEKLKIDSQELINGSRSSSKTPEYLSFSLQRFANTFTLSQSGTTYTIKSENQLSGTRGLYDWNLGRASSSSAATAEATTALTAANGTYYVAPMYESTTSSSNAFKAAAFTVSSPYTYSSGANTYRIAISGDISSAYSAGAAMTSGGAKDYWLGLAFTSTGGVADGASTVGTHAAFSAQDFTATGETAYSTALGNGAYKAMYFGLGANSLQGMAMNAFTADSKTYSVDFYDVKVTGTDSVTGVETGAYVAKLSGDQGKNLLMRGEGNTFNITGVGTTAQSFGINDVDFWLKGASTADSSGTQFTVTFANSYATGSGQTFTLSKIDNASRTAEFELADSNAAVYNGVTYLAKNAETADPAGILFSLNHIDIGGDSSDGAGNFTINGPDSQSGLLYNLTDSATATFKLTSGHTAFNLDVDGTANSYSAISFTGQADASVFGIAGSSALTLGGTFSMVTGTKLSNLLFNFSDSAIAKIGEISFSDTANNDAASVQLTTISDATISGAFSIGLSDFTSAAFTLSDSATAQFGSMTFSDTAGNGTSLVQFNGNSNTFILSSSNMSATGLSKSGQITMSGVGTYSLGDLGTFAATAAGTDAKNQLTFFNGQTFTYAAAHNNDKVTATAFNGTNIGTALSAIGGDSAYTISAGSAEKIGNLFFGNVGSAAGNVSGSNGAYSMTGTYQVSAFSTETGSETVLVGLNAASFTGVQNSTFFLADNGKGVKINTLGFNDVSDTSVSKLSYSSGTNIAVGVYGAVNLVAGTNTAVSYTLNSATGVTGSLAFGTNGLTFAGNGATVANDSTAKTFTLSSASDLSITGTVAADNVFTLSGAGDFAFGNVTIGGSGTTALTSVGVSGFAADAVLASDSNIASGFKIGNDLIKISDAATSATFKIELADNTTKGAAISGIDSGATLYSLGSATQVITNGLANGTALFTFSGTALASALTESKGTATQIFQISGDTDGVTFTLDTNGVVTSISGIDDKATVSVTDNTVGTLSKHSWSKTTSGTWTREANGSWNSDKAFGYIVNAISSGFSATGIAAGTFNHFEPDSLDALGSGEGTLFTVKDTVFNDGTATQVTFLNQQASSSYSVKYGTQTLFSDLKTTGATYGVMLSSDTTPVFSLAKIQENSSSTAVTALGSLDSEVSLTLGDFAFNIATGYVASGTGVGVAVSNTVTVSANGKNAYVAMPEDAGITFGGTTSGTYLIEGLTTNTFVVNPGAGTALGSNTAEFFTLSILGGAAVTDSSLAKDGKLSINGIAYTSVSDTAANFAIISEAGDSDTLDIEAGMLSAANAGLFSETKLQFAAKAGLALDVQSFTGVDAATFTLGTTSDVTKVNDLTGVLNEQVVSGTAFFLNNDIYTATSLFKFDFNSSSSTLLAGSANGRTSKTDTYLLSALTDTFTMGANANITLSYDSTASLTNIGNATRAYNGGEGTATYLGASSQVFAINDDWLTGGDTGSTVYQYTAVTNSDVTLHLTLSSATSGTIVVASGLGTRSDTATTFSYNGEIYSTTSAFNGVENGLVFYIDSNVDSATGVLYTGAGTREISATSESLFTTFLGDTYVADEGTMLKLNVEAMESETSLSSGS